MKKILIMGLPGAGKTTLAKMLVEKLNANWLNADQIRKEYNDWDFSDKGRVRQAKRMNIKAEKLKKEGKIVVADFICPTQETRKIFNADVIVWMDTINEGRFEDTNELFSPPKKFDFRVTEKNAEIWSEKIIKKLNLK
jgi:adenylylsulfate kinase